jgi:LmbE family N-acetylglucosaminyl deacetylase
MTEYTGERMLVFAPHCDDAEFGLGGWMQKAIAENVGEFRVVVACDGSYTRSDGQWVDGDVRIKESVAALQSLGVTNVSHPGWFKENNGNVANYTALVQSIALEVEAWQPTEAFICLPSFNQDHRVLHEAFMTAFRPGQHPFVKHLWAYPYPGSHWGGYLPATGRTYIALTKEQVITKVAALRTHQSQFQGREPAVGPRSALVNMMQWGSEVGIEYAELLFLMREIHR